MDEKSKDDFIKLIQNIYEFVKSDLDIKSLNKNIEKKLKIKTISAHKDFNLEQLRFYITQKKYYYKSDDILKFGDLVWAILPNLKLFSDVKEFNNVLSYSMQIDLYPVQIVAPDKEKLVQIYQDHFKTKNKNERIKILLQISKIIVAQLSREDIKNLNMVLEKKEQYNIIDITFCTQYTSYEIMNVYLPKTKSQSWYLQNCISDNRPPFKAVTGRTGGKPFFTKDRKIMRSGATTWKDLEISPCESK